MTDDHRPDFSPAALSRLVAGLTTAEVEVIIGRFHRPNLYNGREYWSWIGEGGMLRAFFKGPGKTQCSMCLRSNGRSISARMSAAACAKP